MGQSLPVKPHPEATIPDSEPMPGNGDKMLPEFHPGITSIPPIIIVQLHTNCKQNRHVNEKEKLVAQGSLFSPHPTGI
jgi:hypothetical protein